MHLRYLAAAAAAIFLAVTALRAQAPIVINMPGIDPPDVKISARDTALIKRSALPSVRKRLASDICTEEFEPAGAATGSFTRSGAAQAAVLYQYCRTGNGLGQVGIAVIESGKLVRSITADVGWAVAVKRLPDIDGNGIDELALYYSGGMHQGAGGSGIDIIEVAGDGVRPIGWFQAESFNDRDPSVGYRITVEKRQSPLKFFRERYLQSAAG